MFRPMLAPNKDPLSYPPFFRELRFPLLGSGKFDGIRNIVKDKTCTSRSGKALPSYQVQTLFRRYENLDGELIEGSPFDPDTYNRTQSHVMSRDKPGDLTWYVFDYCPTEWLGRPFIERLEKAREVVEFIDKPEVQFVEHHLIENLDELYEFEEKMLAVGFEGVMLRDPYGQYKCGRATWGEGLIYKLKRFQDDEGVLVGIEEAEANNNLQLLDELGFFKRSSKKEGLTPKGIVGTFLVDFNGVIVRVAPGNFKHEQLKEIFENQDKYLFESIIKFRHFPKGVKEAPRHARALGFRDSIDM